MDALHRRIDEALARQIVAAVRQYGEVSVWLGADILYENIWITKPKLFRKHFDVNSSAGCDDSGHSSSTSTTAQLKEEELIQFLLGRDLDFQCLSARGRRLLGSPR